MRNRAVATEREGGQYDPVGSPPSSRARPSSSTRTRPRTGTRTADRRCNANLRSRKRALAARTSGSTRPSNCITSKPKPHSAGVDHAVSANRPSGRARSASGVAAATRFRPRLPNALSVRPPGRYRSSTLSRPWSATTVRRPPGPTTRASSGRDGSSPPSNVVTWPAVLRRPRAARECCRRRESARLRGLPLT